MEQNNGEELNTWFVEPPFTVQVIDNENRPELKKERLYTVTEVRMDLINPEQYGFTLLEQQPEEPYDSYLSSRFKVKIGLLPN